MSDQIQKSDARLAELDADRLATLARQAGWKASGDVFRAEQEVGRLANLAREAAYLTNERLKWVGAAAITIER